MKMWSLNSKVVRLSAANNAEKALDKVIYSKVEHMVPKRLQSYGEIGTLMEGMADAMRAVIPPGTDPLHAMMYLQKKYKSIKDVKGMDFPLLFPLIPGTYYKSARFTCNDQARADIHIAIASPEITVEPRKLYYRDVYYFMGGFTLGYAGRTLAIDDPTRSSGWGGMTISKEDERLIENAIDDGSLTMFSDDWGLDMDRVEWPND